MTIAHLTTIMFAIFYISEVHTNSILKKIIKKYSTINEQDTKDYAILRNALEEIREIAEKYKDMEGCRIPLGAIKMTIDEVLNEKEL